MRIRVAIWKLPLFESSTHTTNKTSQTIKKLAMIDLSSNQSAIIRLKFEFQTKGKDMEDIQKRKDGFFKCFQNTRSN